MNDYQKEHYDAYAMAVNHIDSLSAGKKSDLKALAGEYLTFRKEADYFLNLHFGTVCTRSCYENNRSACCSKDGIIAFFADVVINVLFSSPSEIDLICTTLKTANRGNKCIYLGSTGCLWHIKPIVCEMFLCDAAKEKVFSTHPENRETWEHLQNRKKDFSWPDKPVLFDVLETIFMDAGHSSPMMYLHNSPGLLRIKQKSSSYPDYRKIG